MRIEGNDWDMNDYVILTSFLWLQTHDQVDILTNSQYPNSTVVTISVNTYTPLPMVGL